MWIFLLLGVDKPRALVRLDGEACPYLSFYIRGVNFSTLSSDSGHPSFEILTEVPGQILPTFCIVYLQFPGLFFDP